MFEFPDGVEGSKVPCGVAGRVRVLDLHTGATVYSAESFGWDAQTGAHVQWGATDTQLFYNDVRTRRYLVQSRAPEALLRKTVQDSGDAPRVVSHPGDMSQLEPNEWIPFGVKVNPFTGEITILECTVYQVSPDGNWAISPCLRRISQTQRGYGLHVPEARQAGEVDDLSKGLQRAKVPRNRGAAADDGLYITNTRTGRCRLLTSFSAIARNTDLQRKLKPITPYYGFHAKVERRVA